MYKKNAQGWFKHIDFVIADVLCLQIAYLTAFWLRHGSWAYRLSIYRGLGMMLVLIDVLTAILFNTMHNVLKRGYYEELKQTFKHCALVFAFSAIYVFVLQSGSVYSRVVFAVTPLLHMLLGYAVRLLWKRRIIRRGVTKRETLLAVLDTQTADEMMARLLANDMSEYEIVGAVLHPEAGRTEVCGIPVVADLAGAAAYICQEWIDAVYIDYPITDPQIDALVDACQQMALPVHYHLSSMSQRGCRQIVEKVRGTTVVTLTSNVATPAQLFVKRCMDILGGIVGSMLALIIMAVIGPKIKKASPGPILYSQERIGKNGKHFRMWKIRSMHMDADAHKQELMEQNRVKDGMMFKVDFDPRIIGNEILPDGTRKTGIGEMIRRTSLDEFPQFFNVLLGDMSLVGTRPPTVDEWERYQYHHRARLACKPGITGMWQISGRSDITDFEEVVKLDTRYISEWSMGLDLRILLQTVVAVLRRKGAM